MSAAVTESRIDQVYGKGLGSKAHRERYPVGGTLREYILDRVQRYRSQGYAIDQALYGLHAEGHDAVWKLTEDDEIPAKLAADVRKAIIGPLYLYEPPVDMAEYYGFNPRGYTLPDTRLPLFYWGVREHTDGYMIREIKEIIDGVLWRHLESYLVEQYRQELRRRNSHVTRMTIRTAQPVTEE